MNIQTINSERKLALREDEKYIHIMKYMGSKRALLPDIKTDVDAVLNGRGGVLDLFAGTGSVGMYLQDTYNILSNDIQSYSGVICNALIGQIQLQKVKALLQTLPQLREKFDEHQNALLKVLKNTVATSDEFIQTPKRSWTEKGRKKYLSFFELFPNPSNQFVTASPELKKIWKLYQERSTSPKQFPYTQTVLLFAETYFSTRQCIDIDSMRFAIDEVFKNEDRQKSIALTALIYAHSYCSSGTGHFAMYRDLKDVKSINDVFLYRDRNVWTYFEKKLLEICSFIEKIHGHQHTPLSLDYAEALRSKSLAKKYDLIYADPPYSFVHYSRFYHATESLVRYDYQIPEHKGRYRTDRHQSPFCQKQNVASAFETLFCLASENKKSILLSYSNTGMISQEDILSLSKKYNFKANVRVVNYDHSTLGREGHKSNQIEEFLITFIK